MNIKCNCEFSNLSIVASLNLAAKLTALLLKRTALHARLALEAILNWKVRLEMPYIPCFPSGLPNAKGDNRSGSQTSNSTYTSLVARPTASIAPVVSFLA